MSEHLTLAKEEIVRLRKHPELFPSKEVEAAFNHDITMIFRDALKHTGPEGEKNREKQQQDLLETVMRESGDPSFTPQDPHRKPWQQYLHDRAPGAGLNQSVMADGHSNQVIPHAGLRILENWTLEYHEIYQQMKAVSSVAAKAILLTRRFLHNS